MHPQVQGRPQLFSAQEYPCYDDNTFSTGARDFSVLSRREKATIVIACTSGSHVLALGSCQLRIRHGNRAFCLHAVTPCISVGSYWHLTLGWLGGLWFRTPPEPYVPAAVRDCRLAMVVSVRYAHGSMAISAGRGARPFIADRWSVIECMGCGTAAANEKNEC